MQSAVPQPLLKVSPVHLSADLPELPLVFQRPRCFLVTQSRPGCNLVIMSDSPRLQVCHDNCAHSGDKRARNNMPQLYHIHVCVEEVWGATVYRNAKVSAFSGYPSAAISLAPHHGCPGHMHVCSHRQWHRKTKKRRHRQKDECLLSENMCFGSKSELFCLNQNLQ